MLIKLAGLSRPVDDDQIVWLEGKDNYSLVHFLDGKSYLVSQTLKRFENQLGYFVRIHKASLINPRYILVSSRQGRNKNKVILHTGQQLPVSHRRIGAINDKLHTISSGNDRQCGGQGCTELVSHLLPHLAESATP